MNHQPHYRCKNDPKPALNSNMKQVQAFAAALPIASWPEPHWNDWDMGSVSARW